MHFALTTERYELLAASEEDRARLEERRILARENTELALRAQAASVLTKEQFQRFWAAGHAGLYRETVAQIKARKGLRAGQDLADHLGSLELSANHFKAALARHLVDECEVRDVSGANTTPFGVKTGVTRCVQEQSGRAYTGRAVSRRERVHFGRAVGPVALAGRVLG